MSCFQNSWDVFQKLQTGMMLAKKTIKTWILTLQWILQKLNSSHSIIFLTGNIHLKCFKPEMSHTQQSLSLRILPCFWDHNSSIIIKRIKCHFLASHIPIQMKCESLNEFHLSLMEQFQSVLDNSPAQFPHTHYFCSLGFHIRLCPITCGRFYW